LLVDKPEKKGYVWSRLTNGDVSDMPDYIYNLYEAKTHLSHLIDRVAKEEILIAKSGIPLAKLVPLPKSKVKRKPGGWEGKIHISDDFDAPLPDSIQSAFEGRVYEGK
jgi:prevent-host-death family protein